MSPYSNVNSQPHCWGGAHMKLEDNFLKCAISICAGLLTWCDCGMYTKPLQDVVATHLQPLDLYANPQEIALSNWPTAIF